MQSFRRLRTHSSTRVPQASDLEPTSVRTSDAGLVANRDCVSRRGGETEGVGAERAPCS